MGKGDDILASYYCHEDGCSGGVNTRDAPLGDDSLAKPVRLLATSAARARRALPRVPLLDTAPAMRTRLGPRGERSDGM
jgi:hypothetical protein